MFTRCIALGLIAAIIGCPLCCTASVVGFGASGFGGSSPMRCCCCAHRAGGGAPRPAGEPADAPADKPCQCICGGAVIDGARQAAPAEVDTAGHWAMDLPAPVSLANAGVHLLERDSSTRDRSVIPRRAACLYAVWRC